MVFALLAEGVESAFGGLEKSVGSQRRVLWLTIVGDVHSEAVVLIVSMA